MHSTNKNKITQTETTNCRDKHWQNYLETKFMSSESHHREPRAVQ